MSDKPLNTTPDKKDLRNFDVLQGQLHGDKTKAGSGFFKDGRSPLQGIDLDPLGKEFDVQFAVNANPKEGFRIRMADGPQAASELTQYQIMKGGYDGRNRVLAEFRRAFVPDLDDPFITITFFQRETSINKLMGPLPDGIKGGTLVEWRENAWMEEARKILRAISAYNPSRAQVCRVVKRYESTEITPEEAGLEQRHDEQQFFRESEYLDVTFTPLQNLPKIRYLDNFLRLLGEAKARLTV